jgi:hypothetical protein
MIRPHTRTCDDCGRPTDAGRMAYEVAIDAHTKAPDFRGRYCPCCARDVRRRRRAGDVEPGAATAAAGLLERRFGEPMKVTWLQGDVHRWAVLARRRDGRRATTGRVLSSGPS